MSKRSCLKRITHVIFDMDGTLLDTEKIYFGIVATIAKEFKKTYTKTMQIQLMGTNEVKSAEIAIREMGLPISTDDYLRKFHDLCYKLMGKSELMPGAECMVNHLNDNKIPLAIATSSTQEMLDLKFSQHGKILKMFSHAVCGSTDKEVKRGKPAPDIFCITANRFKVPPETYENCLVFEDSPNGVMGAKAAGMAVVMLPDEVIPPEMRVGADKVLKSMTEFKPEEFTLPPFK